MSDLDDAAAAALSPAKRSRWGVEDCDGSGNSPAAACSASGIWRTIVLNSKFSRVWTNSSRSYVPNLVSSKSMSIGTSVTMVVSFSPSYATCFPSLRRCIMPFAPRSSLDGISPTASRLEYRSSKCPKRDSTVRAAFLPTLGIPGMLSDGSPSSALISAT